MTDSYSLTRMENLLSAILNRNSGEKALSFSNADGKTWVIPQKNMRTAMHLYQPSSAKGKILKILFPYLYWLFPIQKLMHTQQLNCLLRSDIYELLCHAFGVKELEFSIFGGTPCVHQKITIQLSLGNHILGYCKISDNSEILSLFQGESHSLKTLRDRGITNIPQCLFCGVLQDGIGIFVQSTIKTNQSQVIHRWTELHEQFLTSLHENTKQNLLFEDSDYYQTLISLKQHINWLPRNVMSDVVESAIERVLKEYNKNKVEFSAYHADFTPWNMFSESDQLFVFDFEYARLTYPPKLDRYHFFTQTAYFERHWDADMILEYIESSDGKWIDRDTYQLYLLDIISRFTIREHGSVDKNMAALFAFWGDILYVITLNLNND